MKNSHSIARAAACMLALAAKCFSVTNVTHHTHFSKYMGNQSWGYNVYLPDGYDAGTDRYPVIYMLHGFGDTEERMTFMAETLHKAIGAGSVPKTIMVFPNGGKQTFYCDYAVWPWTKGMDADSYLTKELIPHIDSAFRTRASRETRLLQGFSMGGWGSLHFAFKYPRLFGRVCALSPGGRNVDSLDNPTALSARNAEDLKAGTRVRMVAGGADGLKNEADAFDALWTRLGIAHEYEVVPNAKHSPETIYSATGLKDLVFLTRDLATAARRAVPVAHAEGSSRPPEVFDLSGRRLAQGSLGSHTNEKGSALPRSPYLVLLRSDGLPRSLAVARP
jgi:enterochelin esterase-like enzyme